MKIGIPNIFTSAWFLFMLICSGWLTYITFDSNLLTGDLIFIGKFFMIVIVLMFIFFLVFVIINFRIVFRQKDEIVFIKPFLFKADQIALNDIQKTKLENFFSFRHTVYRRIQISTRNKKLLISDLEFENFDDLLYGIPYDEIKKNEIDLSQAKSEVTHIGYNLLLTVFMLSICLLMIIFQKVYHLFLLVIILVNLILLYASIKRKIRYRKILKGVRKN